jgi:RNA polymerase sigma-70 factor (ECF subfamily)
MWHETHTGRSTVHDATGGEDTLAQQFEENRSRLRGVAYRMLGSVAEADDALQETWLRLSRADTSGVHNLAGWLTTVIGRVCLDMLRSRTTRPEQPLDAHDIESIGRATDAVDPEQEAMLAESVGQALLVVLGTLTPAERLAFVLHDMFAVSFDEIALIVGRSPDAVRQLASRARRRVQSDGTSPDTDLPRQRRIVDAFLAASREGEFEDLVTLLDPDVVLRADAAAAAMGASAETRGQAAVARFFLGRAQDALHAIIDGAVGAVVAPGGRPRMAVSFTIAGGRIIGIEAVAAAGQLAELDIEILGR